MMKNNKKKKVNNAIRAVRDRGDRKSDQRVVQYVSSSKVMNGRTASISANGRDIRIRHREYLKEVVVQSDPYPGKPTVSYVEVNPGLYPSFPWLSGLANQFESYTFHSLSLHYVPSCSSATAGSIILSPDFDVSDYEPDTLMQLQTFPGSVRTSTWAEARMICPPDLLIKLVKERMIRSGDIEDVDLKLYDACCLYIAYVGCAGVANTVGSLWVEYDVTLRTPSVDTAVQSADSAQLWADGPSGCTKNTLLGDPALSALKADSYIPIVTKNSTTSLKMERPGQYLVSAALNGTGLTVDPLSILPAVVGTAIIGAQTAIVNAGGTIGWYERVIEVVTPCILNIMAVAGWTTVTSANIKLTPYVSKFGV